MIGIKEKRIKVYEAGEGKIFDFSPTGIYKDRDHFYQKILYLNTEDDSLDNYIEVGIPEEMLSQNKEQINEN